MKRLGICFVLIFLPFTLCANSECITCHQKETPELVKQWRQSGHVSGQCLDCHDNSHKAQSARDSSSCIQCHEGPVEHSYRTSKHGVINQIEKNTTDWSKSLSRGNYRSPNCAYCHMYEGSHSTKSLIDPLDVTVLSTICSGCHSPRYSMTQLEAGERMKNIANLKHEEMQKVIDKAKNQGFDSAALEALLAEANLKGVRNVRLGSGHQSPDYQWWHGHPALDGYLLRIKTMYSEWLISKQK